MVGGERFNVVFPSDVLADLRRLVPNRRRGEFIVEATAKELRRLKQRAVVQKLRERPAWTEADHPDMRTPADIEQWVDNMRASWQTSVTGAGPEDA